MAADRASARCRAFGTWLSYQRQAYGPLPSIERPGPRVPFLAGRGGLSRRAVGDTRGDNRRPGCLSRHRATSVQGPYRSWKVELALHAPGSHDRLHTLVAVAGPHRHADRCSCCTQCAQHEDDPLHTSLRSSGTLLGRHGSAAQSTKSTMHYPDGVTGDLTTFLTVRETARRLGVHENTVRNWAREGVLPDSRVPGSRFLRFRAADVDRLIEQRGTRIPSLQVERRAVNPEFVTANQLKQWPSARARDAQEYFPELMRRLLVETPGITNISIRSGDGIALSGYDGLANSTGTSFLPAGELAFEFGVDERPSAMATSDYTKRISATRIPKTFVFVTPKRWAGGSAWAEDRKRENHFADVVVLDGDDLEGWLRMAPGALYWLSEHLGLRPREALTLETWWERFSSSTSPRFTVGLFLSGRRIHASQLGQRLEQEAGLTVIQSEWADDCLAFVHAALVGESDISDSLPRGTAIVVLSPEAWDSIIEKPGQAVLIPLFDSPDVSRAMDKGHHVIAVVDRSAASRSPVDLMLPRLARLEAAEALRESGLDFQTANRLAALGRRSLPALRRHLSVSPRLTRPFWADAPDALILAPLTLVGEWTANQEDIEILERVAGQPWAILEPLLVRVSVSADPLLRKVTGSWTVASPEEAFLLLRESLSNDCLKRWSEIAIRVLCEPDPLLDLDAADKALAGIRGIRRRHSPLLRRGFAQGLALMGALGSEVVLEDGSTVSDVAARTVQHLLERANTDETGRLWQELAAVLPLLAEAAPDVMLNSIEDDLGRQRPVLLNLFHDERERTLSTLGPSSPHPHLLWALETVCWSADHLIDGVRVLARLAVLDPGSKTTNRPIGSLNTILCGWARHTSASLIDRLQALDAVYRVANSIGWRLTFKLWPTDHGFLIPPSVPRFRDWRPTETAIPMNEWIRFTHALVDRAITEAGADGDRMAQLAEGLPQVPPDDREHIVTFLEERSQDGSLDDAARLSLWERLHTLVARHESFADAAWAMPVALRLRLSSLAAVLEPSSDPQRFAYLFDRHPDLPEIDRGDFEKYRRRLEQLRRDALETVLNSGDGLDGLMDLVRRVAAPGQVGWTLAEMEEIGVPELASWLSSPEPSLTEAAASWARRRMFLGGAEWLADALAQPGITETGRQLLIRNAPAGGEIWKALRESPVSDDEQTYWMTAQLDVVPLGEASEAIERLVGYGRAWMAIEVASFAVHRPEQAGGEWGSDIGPEIVVRALEAALTQSHRTGDISSMTAHSLGELLDYLGKFEGMQTTIAKLEYGFFAFLEYHREPIYLNQVLATQPETFVDLVKVVYRGRDEPRRDLTQSEQDQATHAWSVLHQWKGFPGRREDGSLDPEVMNDWVREARLNLSDTGRSDIGDELIGQAFRTSPVGQDGAWPAEPLRDLVEAIGSRELENGIALGKMNSGGVTWRGVYDGGQQERTLAKQYREWSKSTRASWPRTARILRDLADSFDRLARREDLEAELDSDRG